MLSNNQQKDLLAIARFAIKSSLTGKSCDDIIKEVDNTFELNDIMMEHRGAFVTLKKYGDLRGCIGYIDPVKPLYITVIENSINAAFSDYRFPSVKTEELKDIKIEISVLSPIEPLLDIESILVGRDGLIVKKGFKQGLLLPQVASEYKWDKYEFLSHTCMKAGLPHDEWKKKEIEIQKFSSFVFNEE